MWGKSIARVKAHPMKTFGFPGLCVLSSCLVSVSPPDTCVIVRWTTSSKRPRRWVAEPETARVIIAPPCWRMVMGWEGLTSAREMDACWFYHLSHQVLQSPWRLSSLVWGCPGEQGWVFLIWPDSVITAICLLPGPLRTLYLPTQLPPIPEVLAPIPPNS